MAEPVITFGLRSGGRWMFDPTCPTDPASPARQPASRQSRSALRWDHSSWMLTGRRGSGRGNTNVRIDLAVHGDLHW